MTTLRTRLFIIASVILLLILAISIFLVVISKKKSAATPVVTPTTTTGNKIDQTNFPAQITTPAATTVPNGVTVKPPTSEEVMKNAAMQLAKIFIERYGSYSTDDNYQNIRDVQTLVTDNLWATLSKKIGVPPANKSQFYGVTTKIITVNVTDWQNTTAQVEMSAMRTENKNGMLATNNQKVNVSLVHSGNQWLVDKFEWVK